MQLNKSQIAHTKGRWYGHLFRRLVHVAMLIIPIIYYAYGKQLADFFCCSPTTLLIFLLGLVILLELIRLQQKFLFFGQRQHEVKAISSFTWSAVSIIIVLLYSPGRQFSIPLIWSLAIGDPLLGELRRLVQSKWIVMLSGMVVILLLWWLCAYWLNISFWWGVLLAPITVAVESLKFRWIDDNALMLLVPLIFVLGLK